MNLLAGEFVTNCCSNVLNSNDNLHHDCETLPVCYKMDVFEHAKDTSILPIFNLWFQPYLH